MQPGHNEQRGHDYVRHGATTLFAVLEIVTGKVTGLCKDTGTATTSSSVSSRMWLVPARELELHLVMDNYAAYKRVEVRHWHTSKPVYQGSLHPDVGVMVVPGRGLVRHHRASGHPRRYFRFSPRVDLQDLRIH